MKKGEEKKCIKSYLELINFKFDLKITRCFLLVFFIFISAFFLAGIYEVMLKTFRLNDNSGNIVESLSQV